VRHVRRVGFRQAWLARGEDEHHVRVRAVADLAAAQPAHRDHREVDRQLGQIEVGRDGAADDL